jgi:hypothetical protein
MSAVTKPEHSASHDAPPGATSLAELYELDYARWLFENAALLRAGRLDALDAENIAEELEVMERSEGRAIRSHLRVLITHLLKWEYQADQRSSSWRGSIYNARRAIEQRLRESPSLRRGLPEFIAEVHADAIFNAANETGLPESTFPERCPYAIDQLLSTDFWPDAA